MHSTKRSQEQSFLRFETAYCFEFESKAKIISHGFSRNFRFFKCQCYQVCLRRSSRNAKFFKEAQSFKTMLRTFQGKSHKYEKNVQRAPLVLGERVFFLIENVKKGKIDGNYYQKNFE